MEKPNFINPSSEKKSPEYINPAFEKNQRKKRFLEKYRQRDIMTFAGNEKNKSFDFECIDISPEGKETDKPTVFIAVGTPSNWEQMEDFVFALLESGHRVTSLAHPNPDLKDSFKYDPKIQRPLTIETFFKKKNLSDATVIAHSYGLMDIVRKGTDGIGRVVAINPAGLSENDPLTHLFNSIKSIKKALLSDSKEDKKTYLALVKTLAKQQPLESLKQIMDVAKTDLSEEIKKFLEMLVIFRNDDDTLVPPKKATRHPFERLRSGGDHLGPFLRPDQARKIIATIEKLEKATAKEKISEK